LTKFQKLFQKNIETRKDYFKVLDALDPNLLYVQRNNRWSAMQICEHMLRIEQGTYSNIKTHWNKQNFLPLKSYFMGRVLIKAFQTEKKFQVPAIDSIIPSNSLSLDDLKSEWEACHNNWNDFLGEKQKTSFRIAFRHPVAGFLNMEQTIKQMDAHARRHLRQLKSL
jgi:hypothetical protein